jgi:hypothetical protein
MTARPLAPAQLAPAIRQNARLALSLLSLCTLGLSLSASAQQSTFTTFDPPGSIVETIPTSMNPSGAITGWYFDGNIFHGFLRSRQGAFTILDFPGATGTSGASINPAGTITGYYWGASVPPAFRGFVRSPDGVLTSFDPAGSVDTEPASNNPAGEISGTYYDANHVSHGFLRDRDGAITSFDVPDSNGGTFVTGMTPSGEITGYYNDNDQPPYPQRGFLRSRDGTYTTFVAPPGEGCSSCRVNVLSTYPSSINRAGEIIGNFYRDDAETVYGFVRERDGRMTILDAPCPGGSIFPNSINAAGVIAGNYYGCGAEHGFVRDRDGKIITFDPPGSTYTMPTSINDAGAITGWYVDASSVTHGFLRSPGPKSRR